MNIYLIEQDVNNDYDTYDSAVVVADNEKAARNMHPYDQDNKIGGMWAMPKDVKVTKVGIAWNDAKARVVCASFNAG